MARQARKKSSTNIYHTMVRGIDRRNIFLENEDKEMFLGKLFVAKEKADFNLFGYCLMDNHVHLLLKESEEIGNIMKRITVAYVSWHNHKYARCGHLFQNRYLSEPVETESCFLAVLRYIHQNPIKAMMVKNLDEYPWSSYNEYKHILNNKNYDSNVDGQIATGYFKNYTKFAEFMKVEDDNQYLDIEKSRKHSDAELTSLLNKKYGSERISNLNNMAKEDRNLIIKDISVKAFASIRQLSRVLGLGKGIIEMALRHDR